MSHYTLSEAQFLSIVSTIASQHNCRLIDVDTDRQIVNITGPAKSESDCAIQLEKILGQYTTI